MKIFLEICIIFTLCLSALGKMNVVSIAYYLLVLYNLYYYKRTSDENKSKIKDASEGIRLINSFVCILLFFRFTVFLLNMDPNS
jgi:amino acid transporter